MEVFVKRGFFVNRLVLMFLACCTISLAWVGCGESTPSQETTVENAAESSWEPGTEPSGRKEYPDTLEAPKREAPPSQEGTDENNSPSEFNNEPNPADSSSESQDEPTTQDGSVSNDGGVTEGPSPEQPMTESSPDGGTNDVCSQTPKTYTFGNDSVTLTCKTQAGGLRLYTLQTTHQLRDNDPASKTVQFEEKAGIQSLRIRTGNLLMDALFAMAVHESVQNSVKQIQDGGFNNNQPVPCDCYLTGAKWTWAWTRDTAYSVDLALASLDPKRSENTLLFKISDPKSSTKLTTPQIVQDTGTGGSWPISSDRVIWAVSAWRLLHFLSSADQTAFLNKVYPSLAGTLQLDRKMIYDANDGLYRGEQSFLDWREQTYPSWTKSSLWHIAMSKTLSTNVAHLIALEFASECASRLNKTQESQTYKTWATALRKAIHSKFYLSSAGLYSTMLTTTMDEAPTYKFDLLGNALAILWGVADQATASKVISSYTHSDKGPPVVWPQQPFVPVYHNRAIWPFVTAYWIRAATVAKHAKAVEHNLLSMIRGAALNLSNMENFEFLTGANYHQDGAYSGPVVNSRRQLWSVAGYVSAIQDSLFGLQVSDQGIRFVPFVPLSLRKDWLPADTITLQDFQYQGKSIQVQLKLPKASSSSDGSYTIATVSLNGNQIGDAWFKASQLLSTNTVEITLQNPTNPSTDSIKVVTNSTDYKKFWSPKEPAITKLDLQSGKIQLTFDNNGETGVTHAVYKDGVQVATNLTGNTWTDPSSSNHATESPCYAVDTVYTSSNNRSHHSPPTCWNGANNDRADFLPIHRFANEGGTWGQGGNQNTYKTWGNGSDALEVAAYVPSWTGDSYLQFKYRNPHGGLTTGIACATKRVRVWENGTNKLIVEGYVVMPQTDTQSEGWSTYLSAKFEADKSYRIRVDNDSIVHNMTYLSHFSSFTGGPGGGATSFNQVEMQGLRVFHKKGTAANRSTGNLVQFDGANDLNKLNTKQVIKPGILLETWERFGLTWDNDWIYIVVVSKGFEQDLKPFHLYVESSSTTLPAAKPGQGLTYLKQTPELPFTANFMIGVRQKTDVNDGFGPWNGVWKKTSAGWKLQTRFRLGVDFWLAGDKHTIAYKIHRAELGWPTSIRLAGHYINNVPSNEWKVVIPQGHTPWKASSQGYLEVTLGLDTEASKWLTK